MQQLNEIATDRKRSSSLVSVCNLKENEYEEEEK